MINLQSILSLFDDKPTLLKWLKKVEAALAASVLTSVTISQPSETTAVLTFNFEDGTSIETPAITLPRGASVVNATLDQNNNLILVLDNGRSINVGNIMPQNINAENGTFSVSIATPNANISVATIGNLNVVTNLESESASFAGTIDAGGYYTEGNAEVLGNLHVVGDSTMGNVEANSLNVANGIDTDDLSASGDVSVTGSVTAASFSGENARPLYFHSIVINNPGGGTTIKYRLSAVVINNDPTPFTLTSFKQYLDGLYTAAGAAIKFPCNGGYYSGVSSDPKIVVAYIQKAETAYSINGSNPATGGSAGISQANLSSLFYDNSDVFDDIIKLN